MRILLTGASGFLGRAVRTRLEERGEEVLAPRHAELDLAGAFRFDPGALDAVIHLAKTPRYRDPSGGAEVHAVAARATARLLEL
nr:NAD(P)-dependent oxidoreductase [Thermoleophilaceae bacterium]